MNFKPHLLAASLALVTVTHATLADDYYGTDQAFASEAIYFIMTDRFVDGDSSNNNTNQGCDVNCTWNQQIPNRDSYIGYKGGDFKGILNNVNYLKDMGFSAIWITPIFENPDQAFTGNIGGADHNKTGYHGYWASNFYKVDEHLTSSNLSFAQLADTLENQHGIKLVLDIVANHASHGWDMTSQQYNTSEFGKVYNISGNKVCDHFNTPASQLGSNNCFFNLNDGKPGLGVPLAEFDQSKPFVVDYLDNAFLYWIGRGADAFRIDTVKHVPESYWKQMSAKIRAQYPDFYMFGEYFDSNMGTLSNFEKATDITVLDFAGKDAMKSVFGNANSSFATLSGYLDTDFSIYRNPYELATFYDNHDMARLNANDNGFIDAHNWLFTARGIPVLYYGSEIGFQRGLAEHNGNRNYYGQTNINNAPNHAIYQKLKEVVHLRQANVALQKGLQVNVSLSGNTASFYRVYQKDGVNQTALVLLNKGDSTAQFNVDQYMSNGTWVDAETGVSLDVSGTLSASVSTHDVRVFLFNSVVTNNGLIDELNRINDKKPIRGKNWSSAYLRGTHNNWTTSTPMTFKGYHIWEATATFNPISGQSMRWKIDLKGDWTQNYGDNSPTNGVLDATGADIVITTAGTYTIITNDSTLMYTVTQSTCTEPEATVNPTSVDLGATVPGGSKTGSIAIGNNCPSKPLTISSVSDNASWLTTSLSGTTVSLTGNATDLTDNTYNAIVAINTNGGNKSVPVSLTVSTSTNVNINFTCSNGTTYFAQSVYVVGNIAALGNWVPANALELDPTNYPTWVGTIALPKSTAVEWKCLKREEQEPTKGVQWQGGNNNSFTTPDSGTISVSASF